MAFANFITGSLASRLLHQPPFPAFNPSLAHPSWSFSTIFSPSRAWRTRRATLLEPLLKWLGMTPFLCRPPYILVMEPTPAPPRRYRCRAVEAGWGVRETREPFSVRPPSTTEGRDSLKVTHIQLCVEANLFYSREK